MPFDGLPQKALEDIVRLRTALEGVQKGWVNGKVGAKGTDAHCAVGWLLAATDWDRDEATRLAIDYVFPALPPHAQHPDRRLASIWKYNDGGGRKRVETLFERAVTLAESRLMR